MFFLDERVGGHVCTEFMDSLDDVTNKDVRWRLEEVVWFVIDVIVRLSRCGGSLMVYYVLVDYDCISGVCCDIVDVDCCGGCCGPSTFNFFGMTRMQTRKARNMFEWTDETQLVWFVILQCLIFLQPSIFFCASRACLANNSSVVLTLGAFGRLLA